ncbi:MAG TPA: hypothetical protein VK797_14445 [Tepidisphaeraceae bacterium]|jgi:hypothetical protein|nr:hypothetical protein [Tepidisphaeraceae bacterium]
MKLSWIAGLAAMVLPAVANAGVRFSVGIGFPGIASGTGYYAPAYYAPPVYYAAPPAAYAPAPVYAAPAYGAPVYAPPVVYSAPAPVYYPPPVVYGPAVSVYAGPVFGFRYYSHTHYGYRH